MIRPSYTDRHGIGGYIAVAVAAIGFAAIAVAPYALAIARAAQVIGHA